MNQRGELGHAAVRTHDICRTAPMPPRAPRAARIPTEVASACPTNLAKRAALAAAASPAPSRPG